MEDGTMIIESSISTAIIDMAVVRDSMKIEDGGKKIETIFKIESDHLQAILLQISKFIY